jgi:nitrogen regulatory protein P-II 1
MDRPVRKVQAIIGEERQKAVVERLLLIGIRGLTIIPVREASGSVHQAFFRGGAYPVHFVSKVLLEWVGPDEEVDAVVRAIARVAATGTVGDGRILVEPVEETVRIRTGERGPLSV